MVFSFWLYKGFLAGLNESTEVVIRQSRVESFVGRSLPMKKRSESNITLAVD